MDTLAQGNNLSEVAISNIASHGFWIYIRGRDHFMSYEDFPFFRDHSVEAIANVVECATGTFHWPQIDVKLTAASIEMPEPFQLEAEIINKACL